MKCNIDDFHTEVYMFLLKLLFRIKRKKKNKDNMQNDKIKNLHVYLNVSDERSKIKVKLEKKRFH